MPRTAPALAIVIVGAVALGGLAPRTAQAADAQAWDRLSTALVIGLGTGSLATSLSKSDGAGVAQGLKSAGATVLAAEGLKALVHEPRPDASDDRSFPSEHTALAFAAATCFDLRYGKEYGAVAPIAFGLAALTGVGRVEARKHYPRDVLAGAVIGYGMARAFTTPRQSSDTSPARDLIVGTAVGFGMAHAFTARFYDGRIDLTPTARGVSLSYTARF